MRQISSDEAAANEHRCPCIVELAGSGGPLDVGLRRRIMAFHNARHIQLRHGRSAVPKRGESEAYYRWCFSDLETAQSFAEQFGGTIKQTKSRKM
jgi:hypothetical protein